MKRRAFIKTSGKLGASFIVSSAALGLGGNILAVSKNNDSTMPNAINIKGAKEQSLSLHNGIKMPIFGLGTYSLKNKDGQAVIESALELGYRLIDTAQMYDNEKEVGAAVANAIKGNIKRSEIFIETKLSKNMDYEACKRAIDERINLLNVDYIDLLLLHSPYPQDTQMWKALEEAYNDGKLKAIGISNYLSDRYNAFIKNCKIMPMVNQLETNIFVQRKNFKTQMQKQGCVLQAWSPFAKGEKDFFNNKVLNSIGKSYGKSAAQVGLRYLIELGICVIPKSSKRERLIENMSIFDFQLSTKDKQQIATLDEGKGAFSWYE